LKTISCYSIYTVQNLTSEKSGCDYRNRYSDLASIFYDDGLLLLDFAKDPI
jgi:hypothetical protein